MLNSAQFFIGPGLATMNLIQLSSFLTKPMKPNQAHLSSMDVRVNWAILGKGERRLNQGQ